MKRVLILSLLFFCSLRLSAQNYQLHAVYIYQFTKYIKWPDVTSSEDFVIGVLGETPALEHLEKMAETKSAGNRDIVIRRFASINEVAQVHILFVPNGVVETLAPILNKTKETGTMLITEKEGFGLEGSNINFVERKGRLVFELNTAAMEREQLKVSSELAKLAIVI